MDVMELTVLRPRFPLGVGGRVKLGMGNTCNTFISSETHRKSKRERKRERETTDFAEFFSSECWFDEVVQRLEACVDALHATSLVAIGDGAPCPTLRVTVMP